MEALDAPDVDSQSSQLTHNLLAGATVGHHNVNVIEIAHVAERHSTKLR